MAKYDKRLLTDASALNTKSTPTRGDDDLSNIKDPCVYIRHSDAAATGVVTVETAYDPDYAGTWKSLGTSNASANTEDRIALTGAFKYIRARVSTAYTAGNASAWLVGPSAN